MAAAKQSKPVKMRIKKGDKVTILTGRDKGKTDEVIEVLPRENRVKVRGVNMVKRHQRPTQFQQGGITEMEASIHASNVALVDPTNGEKTRVGYTWLKDGRKVRVAKKSGEVVDS